MKRILLIGNGAREHVIAETFKRSPQECELGVFGTAVNPGMKELAERYEIGSLADLDGIVAFAKDFGADFVFVGPENPLADGVVDALEEAGIKCAAPTMLLAQLESSKSFTRDLVQKYDIPANPEFRVFKEEDGLREFIEELGEYVVKADGLMGGKGVKLSGEHLATIDEGVVWARECIEKQGHVVVEEKLVGQEFSLMSFADGKSVVDMPAVQDHKRAYEGDEGPNTGGMGTWSDADHSLPFLRDGDIADAHAITEAVVKALHEETSRPYVGIMYGGFIAGKNGVRLIEYNARFGDPEAMNVLPLLKSDFVEICEAMIEGRLDEAEVEFEKKATVVKYVVPEGYPDAPVKGEKIEVGDVPEGVKAYYASVDKREDGLYLLGSRAIAFVGVADTIEEAEKLAQSAVASVTGPVFSRADIGTAELIQKRLDHMAELRG
jgi:phosphoribosylamine---glycine ligase